MKSDTRMLIALLGAMVIGALIVAPFIPPWLSAFGGLAIGLFSSSVNNWVRKGDQ